MAISSFSIAEQHLSGMGFSKVVPRAQLWYGRDRWQNGNEGSAGSRRFDLRPYRFLFTAVRVRAGFRCTLNFGPVTMSGS